MQWNGFGAKGSTIAAVLAVVIGVASYLLVSYFRRLNARKEAESVAAKKAADLRYLATGGAGGSAGAGYTVADSRHEEGEAGLTKSLLRG